MAALQVELYTGYQWSRRRDESQSDTATDHFREGVKSNYPSFGVQG